MLPPRWASDAGEHSVPGNWWLDGFDGDRVVYRVPVDVPGPGWRVRFEGVDYRCRVDGGPWHEGYFEPFEADLPAGRRDMVVEVESPREAPEDWPHRKKLIKGALGCWNLRPGQLGPRGQERTSGGIWAPVRLLPTTPLRVSHVLTTFDGDDAHVELRLNRSLSDVSVTFDGVAFDAGSLAGVVPHAKRWWPWDQGEPYRYDVRIDGRTPDGHEIGIRQQIGLRTVEFREGTQLHVNGRRTFLRGSNWCGSLWLSQVTSELSRRDVALAVGANLNALRVHAHVTAPAFYDACDAAGVLVWQDFPLQWGYDETIGVEACRQARAMVDLLAWHPSVAVWCAHNEAPWFEPWLAEEAGDPDRNRDLDRALAETIREADPTRPVIDNSGALDAHAYPGWYFGRWQDHWELPKGGSILSEYGVHAVQDPEHLRAVFPADSDADTWAFHGHQADETREVLGVSIGDGEAVLASVTQTYQAKVLAFATGVRRRARWRFCDGLFQFLLTDPWPSVSKSVLDVERRPKLGYDALRLAMQAVMPSIEIRDDRFPAGDPVVFGVWVVNDTHEAISGATVIWEVGQHRGAVEVDVRPDEARRVAMCGPFELSPGRYRIDAALMSAAAVVIGTDRWSFDVEEASTTGPSEPA